MMIDSDSDEDDDDDDEDREDEDDDDSDGYEPGMLAVGKFFVVVVFCVVVSSVFNLLKIVIVCNSVAELEPIFRIGQSRELEPPFLRRLRLDLKSGARAAWSRPFLSGAGADLIWPEPESSPGLWTSGARARPKHWRLSNTGLQARS